LREKRREDEVFGESPDVETPDVIKPLAPASLAM